MGEKNLGTAREHECNPCTSFRKEQILRRLWRNAGFQSNAEQYRSEKQARTSFRERHGCRDLRYGMLPRKLSEGCIGLQRGCKNSHLDSRFKKSFTERYGRDCS